MSSSSSPSLPAQLVHAVREKLAAQVADEPDEAKRAVQAVTEAIAECVVSEGTLMLPPLGRFAVRVSQPRYGRNPQTGERITIPARATVSFQPAVAVRERLMEGVEEMHGAEDEEEDSAT